MSQIRLTGQDINPAEEFRLLSRFAGDLYRQHRRAEVINRFIVYCEDETGPLFPKSRLITGK